jgi:hypothetical protein
MVPYVLAVIIFASAGLLFRLIVSKVNHLDH